MSAQRVGMNRTRAPGCRALTLALLLLWAAAGGNALPVTRQPLRVTTAADNESVEHHASVPGRTRVRIPFRAPRRPNGSVAEGPGQQAAPGLPGAVPLAQPLDAQEGSHGPGGHRSPSGSPTAAGTARAVARVGDEAALAGPAGLEGEGDASGSAAEPLAAHDLDSSSLAWITNPMQVGTVGSMGTVGPRAPQAVGLPPLEDSGMVTVSTAGDGAVPLQSSAGSSSLSLS